MKNAPLFSDRKIQQLTKLPPAPQPQRRGFAAMPRRRARELQRKGGKTVFETRGPDYMVELGRKSWEARSKKMDEVARLQKVGAKGGRIGGGPRNIRSSR